MIEGLKVVKAFTHEEQAKEAFSRLNDDYRRAAAKANFYSTAIMPVAMNLNNVGYALTAAVGGLLAIFGGFDLGGFTVYLQYSRQVSQPLNQISQQLTTILSALAGAERIFEVMDTQPETDEGKVTLEAVNKAPDGTLSPAAAGRGTGHWAWRVPNRGRMTLVPCVKDGEGNLVRCPENTPDHLWAWSYPEGDPAQGLRPHPGRGDPGEGLCPGGAHRRGAVPGRGFLLRSRQADPPQRIGVCQPGPEDRLCGLHRRGQDHHHKPHQPLLRDRRTAVSVTTASTSRRSRRTTCARSLGVVLAGYPPVHRHRHGEHPLRQAGRYRRRVYRRRQDSRGPTPSSGGFRTDTAPWSRGTAPTSPRASGSCWPSPGPPWPIRPVMILDEATSSIDTRTEAH